MEKPQRRSGRMNKSARTVDKECIAHYYWHHMDDPKCFSKIMIGDFKNGMAIPKKFVANIREKMSEQVTLEVPDGETYIVEVAEEQQKELVLRYGWAEFASACELELGNVLVFTKSGNSHFTVRIFDRSGCEKELSCVPVGNIPCMKKSRTIYKCIAHHYWHHMDDPKCFFKVMIGDFKNGMTIPKKFVANIREKISEQVTLEVPNGKTYTVEVAEEQQELVLRSGWAEFASAYELELGDLLVFTKSGNSHLMVQIFERSGCEKELSCVLLDCIPCMPEREGSHGKQMQSPTGKRLAVGGPSGSRKTPKMNPIDSPLQKKRHVSPTKRHGVAKPSYTLPEHKSLTDEQRSKVEETLGAIQSEIPVYVAVITNSYVRRSQLEISSPYAREYLPSESKNQLTMMLRRKGNTWEPAFQVRNGRHVILGKGWREFVTDNRLELDDICLFNLRKNTKTLTMDVYIIRK